VDRFRVGGHGSLLEGLREGRVGVARPGNVLAGSTVLDGQGGLGDHLAGVGADDVHTQDAVGLGIRDELDETLGLEVGLSAGVGAEGEGADAVLDARGLHVGLVLTDPGDLRVGVHDARDGTVVDVAVALLDELDHGDGLLLGLVRQHGAESAVTDDADVGNLSAVLLVNDQAALLVLLNADVLQAETLGVRSATDGDQNDIGLERLLVATLGSLGVEDDGLAAVVTLGDLGAGQELNALLLEDLLDLLGNLRIHAGATDLVQELNDGNLSTETGPNGSLQPSELSNLARAQRAVRQLHTISRPMIPPPMTTIFLGTSFSERAPVLVMILFSSMFRPGKGVDSLPVAMMMFLPRTVSSPPPSS